MSLDQNSKPDTNGAILEQGKRIRALHEIISRPDLSFDEQIDETLRLGCKLLGTEIGKVGKQDPEHNISEFLNTIVIGNLPAKRGITLPLDKTYCNITFSSPQTIAINDVKHSEYKDHPAVEFLGMQTYIGCSINVHGKKFGTVNFSNRAPRATPFSEADKDLVNLIGSWISIMMERSLEAEELRKSKETAELANLAKSVFLANMSHEIRTPLTAIIGFSDIALDDDQTMDQRVSSLEIIRSSSKYLLNLINHILDLSKIEADELDIENTNVNLVQLLKEIESIVSGHAKRRNIQLGIDYKFPIPDRILTDELRLKQILLNLCNNAIKFTEEGEIRIVVSYDQSSQSLAIEVKDTGIGISKDNLEKIFEPFKQADASTTRQYGGTGLGLSLSKRIAKLLNGSLTAVSEELKGSVFTLTLNLHVPEDNKSKLVFTQNELSQTGISSTPIAKLPKLCGHVLLVDDNELNQLLIRKYLEKMGATLTIANNGATAVSLAQQTEYDLIFMDMQMPILSGVDAVKILREMHYTKPIVMLTANATLEDRVMCEQAGSNDFVTKPILSEKLYEITARYLSLADGNI
ncbi:MAG: ATP-binding protein [Gammaproteobacteria bacterium]|nr:ATP-binding protein [Gammaproteobacteria bacterium]